jgi:hypothetical protein
MGGRDSVRDIVQVERERSEGMREHAWTGDETDDRTTEKLSGRGRRERFEMEKGYTHTMYCVRGVGWSIHTKHSRIWTQQDIGRIVAIGWY